MSKFLHRDDAPFSGAVWNHIDEVVIGTAKGQLTGRRMLDIEGPFGLGLKALMGSDKPVKGGVEFAGTQAIVSASEALPIAEVRVPFALGTRDIAAFEETGQPFSGGPAAMAAIAAARQEDDIIFNGAKALGLAGLLNVKGSLSQKLKSWKEVGTAVDDIIAGVTKLDDAGFHGPYMLALAPALHNQLFRRYPDGNTTEIDHLRSVIGDHIVKAPAIDKGGVLLASGVYFVSIVVGQDMAVGFVGPSTEGYDFFILESLALRVRQADTICLLNQ